MDSHNSGDTNADLATLEKLVQDLKRIHGELSNYKKARVSLERYEIHEYSDKVLIINHAAKKIIKKYQSHPIQIVQDKFLEFTTEFEKLNGEIVNLMGLKSPQGSPAEIRRMDYAKMLNELLANAAQLRQELDESEYLPSHAEIKAARKKLDKMSSLAVELLEAHKSIDEPKQKLPENMEMLLAKEIQQTREFLQELEEELLEHEQEEAQQQLGDGVVDDNINNGNEFEGELEDGSELDDEQADDNKREEVNPVAAGSEEDMELEDDDDVPEILNKILNKPVADLTSTVDNKPTNSNISSETTSQSALKQAPEKTPEKSGKDKDELFARVSSPAAVSPKTPVTSAVSPASQEIILQAGKQKATARVSADIEGQPGSEMTFVCKFVEEQLKNKNPDDPIKIIKCPRKIERALVAYCDYMGYKLDRATVKVKFNSGEKENMIRGYEKLINETPELKTLVEASKAATQAATKAKTEIPDKKTDAAPKGKEDHSGMIPDDRPSIKPVSEEVILGYVSRLLAIDDPSSKIKNRAYNEIFSEIKDMDVLYQVAFNIFNKWIGENKNGALVMRDASNAASYLCGCLYRECAKREGDHFDVMDESKPIPEGLNILHALLLQDARQKKLAVVDVLNVVVASINIINQNESLIMVDNMSNAQVKKTFDEIPLKDRARLKAMLFVSPPVDDDKNLPAKRECCMEYLNNLKNAKYQKITLEMKDSTVKNNPEYISAVKRIETGINQTEGRAAHLFIAPDKINRKIAEDRAAKVAPPAPATEPKPSWKSKLKAGKLGGVGTLFNKKKREGRTESAPSLRTSGRKGAASSLSDSSATKSQSRTPRLGRKNGDK